MKKLATFIVNKQTQVFISMLFLTVAGVFFMSKVNIVTDLTRYLPENSTMKKGVARMVEDFPNLSMNGAIRVMTTGLDETGKEEVLEKLKEIPNVAQVKHKADSDLYNKDEYALFELTVLFDYKTPEMEVVKENLESLSKEYPLIYQTGEDSLGSIPPWILVMALVILFTILFLMCKSFTEPLLFLITIGCAIAINNGSNAFLSGVSNVTHSIAAILQLVLSMDYSIILVNRYREEKKNTTDNQEAMKLAIAGAAPSIASSSMTTVVGLLALVFMSFTIGADIGIVLAKGVLISMICILTMLPFLILKFDGLIKRTEKKVIPLPTAKLSAFSYRAQNIVAAAFLLLFVTTFALKGNALITYTLFSPNPIDDVFQKSNAIVVLYDNEDEDKIPDLLAEFESDPNVRGINCYASTLGKPFTCEEMLNYIAEMGFGDEIKQYSTMLNTLYEMSPDAGDRNGEKTLTPEQLFSQVLKMADNPLFGKMIPDDMKERLSSASSMLESGKNMLIGKTTSILMFDTSYPPESAETNAFLDKVTSYTEEHLAHTSYLIGNSPMQYETSKTFKGELNKISLITAGAIFVVVLLTFHNFCIPVLLVLLIQTAVYLTMLFMGLIGSGIYYLALLIVQSILMGATIDYGILLVSLYREARTTLDIKDSIADAFQKAIHTIMTSGLIIVLVTWIVGYAFADPSITQICHIITVGSIMALTLILVLLPGTVAFLDKKRLL